MAGGPSTPTLVVAAADAGALGFLAGGYQRADRLDDQIDIVRSATTGAFGVNVFVPGAPSHDEPALRDYLRELEADAEALGTDLGSATWDDDDWDAKTDLLIDTSPPIVSFTFGCPPPALVSELQQRGTTVMVTVTNLTEARRAAATGTDALCLQGIEAGAHRSTFTTDHEPDLSTRDLLGVVAGSLDLPLVAAGGIADPPAVREALAAGAEGVQVGTVFLRCPESGAHRLHKDALGDPQFTTTVLTKSFSGRQARGLANDFMRRHPSAPDAYPEINNATRPLRAAAATRGDLHTMSLWAGTGYRHARNEPATDIIDWLSDPSASDHPAAVAPVPSHRPGGGDARV